ncbi:MAG: RNA-binding transcriptional accessory protein, partial [Ignavibacteriaceae bacterium]|nr:RNA-binding transcriptional accessory protein [Ignavibacteriaceae bacterium]
MHISEVIAKELTISSRQVETVIEMLKEGATIPFIARYRKEKTGGLDEDFLRQIEDRLNYLTLLEERKEAILKSIEEQGKLTDELKAKIIACTKLQELEDLYLPYKPKRKTRGTIAKAKGLEPLALFILDNPLFSGDFDAKLAEFINEELGVKTIYEALQGAKDIIAEMISEHAEVRKVVREILLENVVIKSEKTKENATADIANEKLKEKERKEVYQVYFDFQIDIKKIKPYQILALNRGEREKLLKIALVHDEIEIHNQIKRTFLAYHESFFMEILEETIADSFKRLIFP